MDIDLEGNQQWLEKILRLIVAGQEEKVNLSGENWVPRFGASNTDDDASITVVMVLLVGVCFIALLGFLHFQLTQLLIWQISSVTITTLPIYSFLMLYLASFLGGLEFEKIYMTVLFFGPLFGGILYILAQVVTLVLVFTSLRGLPPGAYETVHWTTFIPHV